MASEQDSVPNSFLYECIQPNTALRYLMRRAFIELRNLDAIFANTSASAPNGEGHKFPHGRPGDSYLFDQFVTLAHEELDRCCRHDFSHVGFTCNPGALRFTSRAIVLDQFLRHFRAWMTTLEFYARGGRDWEFARRKVLLALLKFAKDQHRCERCVEPAWRFLIRLCRINNEIMLARMSHKPFRTVREVPTYDQISRLEAMSSHCVDPSELPPNEIPRCHVCWQDYTTFEEARNLWIFKTILPLDPCEDGLGPKLEERPDTALRRPCGHFVGMNCLRDLLVIKGGGMYVLCPLCRALIVRRYTKDHETLLELGLNAGFEAVD